MVRSKTKNQLEIVEEIAKIHRQRKLIQNKVLNIDK